MNIKIKLSTRTLNLSAEDAKLLYDELSKLYGAKEIVHVPQYIPYNPPIQINPPMPYFPRPWETWCNAGTSIVKANFTS